MERRTNKIINIILIKKPLLTLSVIKLYDSYHILYLARSAFEPVSKVTMVQAT
jgi:hypothetical protein